MSDPLRFFVPAESLRGDPVAIAGEPYHHLRNVLRCKPGSVLLLLDGRGQCCEVRLDALQPQQALARVLRRWQAMDSALPITLLQALPKGDKLDLILQKGTELGISRFLPLTTEHAITHLPAARLDKRQQRWQRIVSEAARQSRRCCLPEVRPPQALLAALGEASEDLKLVLWEGAELPLAQALPQHPPRGVRLLVGPEGGFSTTEMRAITAAGFLAVHLGPRILRTETAGLAAAPVLQYLYGDWQNPPVGNKADQHEENS